MFQSLNKKLSAIFYQSFYYHVCSHKQFEFVVLWMVEERSKTLDWSEPAYSVCVTGIILYKRSFRWNKGEKGMYWCDKWWGSRCDWKWSWRWLDNGYKEWRDQRIRTNVIFRYNVRWLKQFNRSTCSQIKINIVRTMLKNFLITFSIEIHHRVNCSFYFDDLYGLLTIHFYLQKLNFVVKILNI